jgi:pimeloyl-ACP methyl ester carboxylesterase
MPIHGVEDAWVVVPQVRGMRETVYGVKTHYVVGGQGEPVIFVHGGGPGAGGAAGWALNTIPALADTFRCYAIDLIGYGHTDKPRIAYSFQTQVEHLAGFIDALGLDQVRLVGNSQGSYVAIKYALDHPARAKAAALISTGTLAGAMGLRDRGNASPLPRFDGSKESLRAFLEVIVNDPAQLTDELLESRYAAASLPGHLEMHRSLDEYRKIVREDLDQQQVYMVRERLPKLQMPWCMIWGADDRSAPLESLGRGMQELCPNVPFHVVEGSGHQVQNDKPKECNRILREFLTQGVRQPALASV